jgi:hypothetical protein
MGVLKGIIKGSEKEPVFLCNYVAENSLRELWERRLTDYCLGAGLKLRISALPLEKESHSLEAKMVKEPGDASTKRLFSSVGELLAKDRGKDLFFYRIQVSADRKRAGELNIKGIFNARADMELTLKASKYEYIEILPQD